MPRDERLVIAPVALPAVLAAFLGHHRQAFAQRVEQSGARRCGDTCGRV